MAIITRSSADTHPPSSRGDASARGTPAPVQSSSSRNRKINTITKTQPDAQLRRYPSRFEMLNELDPDTGFLSLLTQEERNAVNSMRRAAATSPQGKGLIVSERYLCQDPQGSSGDKRPEAGLPPVRER
jgi:hypothetical protein